LIETPSPNPIELEEARDLFRGHDDDGDVGALPPRPPFEDDGAPSEPSEDDVRPDRWNMTTGRGRRARGAARCEGFSDTLSRRIPPSELETSRAIPPSRSRRRARHDSATTTAREHVR
jgi:hypothetical protein